MMGERFYSLFVEGRYIFNRYFLSQRIADIRYVWLLMLFASFSSDTMMKFSEKWLGISDEPFKKSFKQS